MEKYIISCSSTADLNLETYEKMDIRVISMRFMIAGTDCIDDFGKTITSKEFYQAMRDGADTKTTQINEGEYYDYFKNLINDCKKILHLELSSGLSGSVQNAVSTAKKIMQENPDVTIKVVDSLGASSGMGLLVYKLAKLREAGKSFDEAFEFANENKLNVHHWFFSTDLTFFVKGGRVSKASGWFGTLLRICPLLNMSFEGKLIPRYKIIGKKRVYKTIVDKMAEHCNERENYNEDCFISNSDCIEDALEIKKLCEERMRNLKGKIKIFDIGSTIGSHTGPGTVALFFFGNKRAD